MNATLAIVLALHAVGLPLAFFAVRRLFPSPSQAAIHAEAEAWRLRRRATERWAFLFVKGLERDLAANRI